MKETKPFRLVHLNFSNLNLFSTSCFEFRIFKSTFFSTLLYLFLPLLFVSIRGHFGPRLGHVRARLGLFVHRLGHDVHRLGHVLNRLGHSKTQQNPVPSPKTKKINNSDFFKMCNYSNARCPAGARCKYQKENSNFSEP